MSLSLCVPLPQTRLSSSLCECQLLLQKPIRNLPLSPHHLPTCRVRLHPLLDPATFYFHVFILWPYLPQQKPQYTRHLCQRSSEMDAALQLQSSADFPESLGTPSTCTVCDVTAVLYLTGQELLESRHCVSSFYSLSILQQQAQNRYSINAKEIN